MSYSHISSIVPRTEPQNDRNGDATHRAPSPVPKLVTSLNSPISKQRIVPEYLPPPTPPISITSTSEMMSEGLLPPSDRRSRRSQDDNASLHSPPGSPTHSRGSFTDDPLPRSTLVSQTSRNLAPDMARYGTSPSSQYGASPTSQFSTSPARSRPPTSPRTLPADRPDNGRSVRGESTLLPDEQGRPIPLDAKWTQIKRSLISTEILDQDKRRYEA